MFQPNGHLAYYGACNVAWHAAALSDSALLMHVTMVGQIQHNTAVQVEEEFVGAIRGQEKVRRTTFEAGLRGMEFTGAVTRSYQTGTTVKLPLIH